MHGYLPQESPTELATLAALQPVHPFGDEVQPPTGVPVVSPFSAESPPSLMDRIWELGFLTLFWAYKGVEVYYFYQLQTSWFGADASWRTVAVKVLMDQFCYTLFWACWTCVAAFQLRDHRFQWQKWWALITHPTFWIITLPMNLLSNWAVWIPVRQNKKRERHNEKREYTLVHLLMEIFRAPCVRCRRIASCIVFPPHCSSICSIWFCASMCSS
jgi:hypothetical protein